MNTETEENEPSANAGRGGDSGSPVDMCGYSNPPPVDRRFELLKLEYEKCTARYENIYKAIWTQFSYLATIAGVVFGFIKFQGGGLDYAACYSIIPLAVWLVVTYIPLDYYGCLVAARIARIEQMLNKEYGSKTDQPDPLEMFTEFINKRGFRCINKLVDPPFNILARVFRVRVVVCVAAISVPILLLNSSCFSSGDPEITINATFLNRGSTVEVTFSSDTLNADFIEKLRSELEKLDDVGRTENLDEIENDAFTGTRDADEELLEKDSRTAIRGIETIATDELTFDELQIGETDTVQEQPDQGTAAPVTNSEKDSNE